MKITKERLKQIIKEELTRKDKADIKKIVQDELGKLLKKKETKQAHAGRASASQRRHPHERLQRDAGRSN